MAIYFKDKEITNIDNLVPQTGLDITDMWFGSTNVYTVWKTYEGTLPATINAGGADMRQYQIYGASGGIGEEVDITGLSEPLCGIGTYTDSLGLSTGILTRRIKKLVLTGAENWRLAQSGGLFVYSGVRDYYRLSNAKTCLLTHYIAQPNFNSNAQAIDKHAAFYSNPTYLYNDFYIFDSSFENASAFKAYLADQYAAGTPVTVWYVLAEPEVSTITIPSGLTGTLEGYLIQDGTPTPETPIYPTANGVKQVDNTYSIKYGYKLDMSVSDGTTSTTVPIYIGSDQLGKDEYVDYQSQKVYRMINGILTPTDPPSSLPALPTQKGTTIVDYAGQSVATPEKVLLKYRKEGY